MKAIIIDFVDINGDSHTVPFTSLDKFLDTGTSLWHYWVGDFEVTANTYERLRCSILQSDIIVCCA